MENGEMSPRLSVRDHLRDLAWEVHHSIPQISAHLSAAGFDDIPDNGPLVLLGIGTGITSTAEMAAILDIAEQEVDGTIGALVHNGYLEYRELPGERGGTQLTRTERAQAAGAVASAGLRVARWANFPFRQGDIIICTWPKTGTTWLQWICALLIFQSQELPAPFSELSVYFDKKPMPRDGVYAELDAQEHRRIIKTHLPLNDMPIDPRATYITAGRHPLDVALSLYHHGRNENGVAAPRPDQSAQQPVSPQPVSPHEELLQWFDTESAPGSAPEDRYRDLAGMLRHLSTAWARRRDANVVLVHYQDLSADLGGEMRRIAAGLEITVPDALWPSLVEAATFKQMRASASRFVPSGAHLKNPTAFFRSGVSGEGRGLLSDAELARYHARAEQLAPPDLLAWLHRG